ncbi:uncharacterized protein LOC116616243 [Nematostella vectensis]|uniref:uncharacterized protein LOC116616243 n=1 Tax=Nematostella vectensis TaxID=45351 RepID=UPI0013905E88|nr:uncharacterized protein LOC116616243 [Nematostella vectensis]
MMFGYVVMFILSVSILLPVAKSQTTQPSMALAQCLKCQPQTPYALMKLLITQNYMFVKPPSNARSTQPMPLPRMSGGFGRRDSYQCPFRWATDLDSNRKPFLLVKAVLTCDKARDPTCARCQAINYAHQVLTYKCGASRVWDWSSVQLPVAYMLG